MSIEINISSIDLYNLLSNSINRLLERIDEELVDSVPIVVTDLQHIPTLFPSNARPNEYDLYSRILTDSFGITQPKRFFGGERKHLLVLNSQIIESLDLTESELDAVMAHELGHIFNEPDRNIEDYESQKEFYADYFAKSIDLKEPLISSIEKYLRQNRATNIDLFKSRIEKLNSDEIFKGSIKTL